MFQKLYTIWLKTTFHSVCVETCRFFFWQPNLFLDLPELTITAVTPAKPPARSHPKAPLWNKVEQLVDFKLEWRIKAVGLGLANRKGYKAPCTICSVSSLWFELLCQWFYKFLPSFLCNSHAFDYAFMWWSSITCFKSITQWVLRRSLLKLYRKSNHNHNSCQKNQNETFPSDCSALLWNCIMFQQVCCRR